MNENAPVQDRISNYTNRQLFDALDNDVRSMPEFRDRFLQENGLNSNVIDLFTQYHYL